MAAWNVTTAVYLQEFSVAAKETSPQCVFFKPDGLKMYIIGSNGRTVDEYNLGTAWKVTTAVYLQEFSVAAKEISPSGVFFKSDGLKMYTIGSDGDSVDEYDLNPAWDISTAVYLQEFSVAAKELTPTSVFFKPDGLKMYTIGRIGDSVDEYDLGTAWDVLTAIYLQEFSVAAKEANSTGVFFKPDGLKMYTVGYDGDTVDEYDLGTAWNVTTAVYLQEFSVAAKETNLTGVFFKSDGLKMYTIGSDGDTVDEYDLAAVPKFGSLYESEKIEQKIGMFAGI
jgi:DNA-binding beta-propeller fold protein YncE